MQQYALFRFEASPEIGAGHAIRSCVIADALQERGWICKIVTSAHSYDFIKNLVRFERVEPEKFYKEPQVCDLLVIDHYGLDETYEKHFRSYANKIMIIDDLANRKHDCDILLDQTFGREALVYKDLVPQHCKVLVGSDYTLLRKEFTQLRPKALEKRRQTTEVKRILISMGGSDPNNYTLKALKMIEETGFQGAIDIALGFRAANLEEVQEYINKLPNETTLHLDADMPKLIYEADLAIGAAGSSVWERCCLGLKQYLFKTAENQTEIIKKLSENDFCDFLKINSLPQLQHELCLNIDGLGVVRILNFIEEKFDYYKAHISHQKIKIQDMDQIYNWQQEKKIREFSFVKTPPSYNAHKKWFHEKLNSTDDIFEKIFCKDKPCGALRLAYLDEEDAYLLNWYITPDFQGRGIGTIVLSFSKYLSYGKKIKAFVFNANMASHKAIRKAGFQVKSSHEDGMWYEN